MAYFAAEKASEDAINILNRALQQERALSPFEISRIEKNLESVKRAGFENEYNVASACFYAVIGDVEQLLISSENVFNSKYTTSKDKLQVIFALSNSLRYSDIHKYSSYIDEEDYLYYQPLVDTILISYIVRFDFDKVEHLLSRLNESVRSDEDIIVSSRLAESMQQFFDSKDEKKGYEKYIVSVLDWYSENILVRARSLIGYSSLKYSFYEDEAIKFLNISIQFKSGDFDTLLDLEDELITYIANSDFPSEVKSSIAFSMRFKQEDDESGLKDKVEIYD
jgi:hypothetical protein